MNRLQYLQTAKQLTGSSDLNYLFQAALEIEAFVEGIKPTTSDGEDLLGFVKKLSLQHPTKGPVAFEPYEFQNDLLEMVRDNQFTITSCSRQLGISITMGAYALWEACRKPNQTIYLAGPRLNTSFEFLDRIRYMIEEGKAHVPYVTTNNRSMIEFNNGSKIIAGGPSTTGIRGRTIDIMILIDFAYWAEHMAREFWATAQPHFRSKTGKCVIFSNPATANSDHQFNHIWSRAPQNGFVKRHLPWSVHPERDEAWAEPYRSQIGAKAFAREFEAGPPGFE